jgi:hypothetical protein
MKRKTRNNRKKVRGGCGCANSILGGSTHLDSLPARYYYELNSQENNPIRLNGGKRRRIRGGSLSLMSMPTIGMVGGLGYSNFNDSTVQPDMINGTKQYFA